MAGRPLTTGIALASLLLLMFAGCPTEGHDDDVAGDDDATGDDDAGDDDVGDDDTADDDSTGDDDTSDPCEDHCTNGLFDCGETDVDCGGDCDACEPVQLWGDLTASFPAVAATADKVVVAWCDGGARWICRDASGWSAVQAVPGMEGAAKATRLQADTQGRVHLVSTWGAGNGIYYSVLDAAADCASSGWTNVEVISGAEGGRYANVAVDTDGDPHVCWHDVDYTNVYYRKASSGAWSAPVTQATATQWDSRFCDISVAGLIPHLIYEQDDESYSNCHPSYIYWTGAGFTDGLDLVDSYHSWPQIVMDPSGEAHVLYTGRHGDCDVVYRRTGGGGWEPEQVLSTGPTEWTWTGLAVDGNGTLHGAWHQLIGGKGQVHYATGDAAAGTWQIPRQVSIDDALDNWQQALAVDPAGHTHIVWMQVEGDESGRVFYRKVTYDDL